MKFEFQPNDSLSFKKVSFTGGVETRPKSVYEIRSRLFRQSTEDLRLLGRYLGDQSYEVQTEAS